MPDLPNTEHPPSPAGRHLGALVFDTRASTRIEPRQVRRSIGFTYEVARLEEMRRLV
jgi:hypothetical protein